MSKDRIEIIREIVDKLPSPQDLGEFTPLVEKVNYGWQGYPHGYPGSDYLRGYAAIRGILDTGVAAVTPEVFDILEKMRHEIYQNFQRVNQESGKLQQDEGLKQLAEPYKEKLLLATTSVREIMENISVINERVLAELVASKAPRSRIL